MQKQSQIPKRPGAVTGIDGRPKQVGDVTKSPQPAVAPRIRPIVPSIFKLPAGHA